MAKRKPRIVAVLATIAIVGQGGGLSSPVLAQQPVADVVPQAYPECTVDLARTGTMRDILSNALVRSFRFPARDVAAFLDEASAKCATGPELLNAAALHFKVAEELLAAKVEKYKHCNCAHAVDSGLPQALRDDPQAHPGCDVDLALAGTMSDVLSNALVLGLKVPEQEVRAFLSGADKKYDDGPDLLKAVAAHFKLSEDVLANEARAFRHVNCELGADRQGEGPPRDDGTPVSAFAKNVTLHVVLHEMGHALVREFDIPVLANEETLADAFATYYLTTYLPDRAVEVLAARVTSLMIEASEETGEVDWSGEHDHDARRANQIAALAIAADPVKYKPVADIVGMSEEDIKKAVDYGGEIRRSWRRVLAPLFMPDGIASAEARVAYDENNGFLDRLFEDGLASVIESAIRRIDWHSQVTVRFVDGVGGAGWNRSARTITVNSAYVRRFIKQGERGLAANSK